METAVLSVTILILAVALAWSCQLGHRWHTEVEDKRWDLILADKSLKAAEERNDRMREERDELLRQKENWRTFAAEKPSPFDKDAKMPSDRPNRRYVPVAVARAQAERASLGPQTHSEQVVANNARAIESA